MLVGDTIDAMRTHRGHATERHVDVVVAEEGPGIVQAMRGTRVRFSVPVADDQSAANKTVRRPGPR
jgi:hypothetical protein